MNNRILSQKKAAWMKYRCKIRRCTESYHRVFALDRIKIDYMDIIKRCFMNYKDYRKMGERW